MEACSPAWLARALRDHRVVMLDQRGTGRSTPVGLEHPLPEGAIDGATTLRAAIPHSRPPYLTHFRADAIVHDAELLREHLGASSWSLLGQSFGGFTTLRYLSAHAGSVDKALFTGGLPTVGPDMDDVYADHLGRHDRPQRALLGTVSPETAIACAPLRSRRGPGGCGWPDGQSVGVERLRRLGHLLGASQERQERLHYLLDLEPDITRLPP